jgi:hypothetical protein
MSNIITASVTIRGIRPLIQHRFGPDSLPLEKQERTGVAGNDPQEWRKTCMVNKDGQLFILPTYVFSCFREGSKNIKKGRGSIMPAVASTLQVTDDFILLDRYFPNFPNGHSFDVTDVDAPPNDLTAPVFLDICGVRNPATKARNVRYRVAANTGWRATFNLRWDKTIVSRDQMQAVAIDAGNLVGLGDGRSVGYGRFEIESFDIQD